MAPPIVTVHSVSFNQREARIYGRHTCPQTNSARNGLPTQDSCGSTYTMSTDSTSSHPPVVLACCHRNGGDLGSISPLAQERHDKGLHPRRTQEQRTQIVDSSHDISHRGLPNRGRLARAGWTLWWRRKATVSMLSSSACAACFKSIWGYGRPPSRHSALLMFLFLQFHFDLFHFFTDPVIRAHSARLEEHLDPEDEEKTGGCEIGESLRN